MDEHGGSNVGGRRDRKRCGFAYFKESQAVNRSTGWGTYNFGRESQSTADELVPSIGARAVRGKMPDWTLKEKEK